MTTNTKISAGLEEIKHILLGIQQRNKKVLDEQFQSLRKPFNQEAAKLIRSCNANKANKTNKDDTEIDGRGYNIEDDVSTVAEEKFVGLPVTPFTAAVKLPFPMDSLYVDSERKQAHNLLNLYNGLGRTFFNPASTKVFSRADSFKTALKNYTIQATPDDISSVLQQGGMFVFKGKKIVYGRMDEGTGDHAPIDDIFDACCKIPVT